MSKGSLILIDDDRLVRESMSEWLREQGYQVDTCDGREQALQQIDAGSYDLVLTDIRLQDGDGFQILDYCRANHPELTVILLTGHCTVENGVDAIRAGAFDLLTKPLIDKELEISIERALSQRKVIEENEQLRQQLDIRFGMDNVIGHDVRMQRVFDVIDSVADTRATILITGESGTGKSLIARAIHRRSNRRNDPFVEVACGALPDTLLESELFGHVAGAFTNAVANKTGKFKLADNGTIFLDEIGTSSVGMQVKLLRVLQELQFEPVGGTETISVDTRVILATNEDLGKAVAEGRFRQDLFYRVNVINVELPSLRERPTDIPILAQHFLEQIAEDTGKDVSGLSKDSVELLQQYAWPGNVRELQNVIERSVLLGKGSVIQPADLPSELRTQQSHYFTAASGKTLKDALSGPERQIILQTLEAYAWNRNATADALGINRTTLYKKMKRLGLEERRTAYADVPDA